MYPVYLLIILYIHVYNVLKLIQNLYRLTHYKGILRTLCLNRNREWVHLYYVYA